MYCNIYVCRFSIDVLLYIIGSSIDREIKVPYGIVFLLGDFELQVFVSIVDHAVDCVLTYFVLIKNN